MSEASLPRAADVPTMSMSVRRPSADDGVVTIGVVVDIPNPHGKFLRKSRSEFGDPLALAIPPHVTLLPPTDVSPAAGRTLNDHLDKTRSSRQGATLRTHAHARAWAARRRLRESR